MFLHWIRLDKKVIKIYSCIEAALETPNVSISLNATVAIFGPVKIAPIVFFILSVKQDI